MAGQYTESNQQDQHLKEYPDEVWEIPIVAVIILESPILSNLPDPVTDKSNSALP
jgi:hypothetical protein